MDGDVVTVGLVRQFGFIGSVSNATASSSQQDVVFDEGLINRIFRMSQY